MALDYVAGGKVIVCFRGLVDPVVFASSTFWKIKDSCGSGSQERFKHIH